MAAAGDVPSTYDLVIAVSGGNTTGYLLNDAVESSLPFRTHKAIYTYTPTFISRQNVQGDFGDNTQDFFLTATQKDWSLGEQQRYFRSTDEDAKRRYWVGSNVNVASVPGQASLRSAATSATLGGAFLAGCQYKAGKIAVADATNLYVGTTTLTSQGAHGTALPGYYGMATDGVNVYLSAGVATSVRKWNGAAFSNFSVTPCDSLCFLNNTLYGTRGTNGDLIRYDTAGVATSLFTWKDAAGAAIAGINTALAAYGGKLAILRFASSSVAGPPELWIYDGTSPSLAARLPDDVYASDIAVSSGTIYIGAVEADTGYQVIYYYAGGSLGILWRSSGANSPDTPKLAPWRGGLLFHDRPAQVLAYYNAATGGVSSIAAASQSAARLIVSSELAAGSFSILVAGTNTYYSFTESAAKASSGTLTTSLFDFENSLTKIFRGITLEFNSATDGNGGTVDIAYRVEDVDGSYTTLQTTATSGTEYTLSGVSGKRISVKVTLNKGTSTNGPVLKRISVRAAPTQNRYRQREYILNCAGDPSTEDKLLLRDGSPHPLSGRKQVDQLVLAATSLTPLTSTDRFGSFTSIIEGLDVYEMHPGLTDPSSSGIFQVKLSVREV